MGYLTFNTQSNRVVIYQFRNNKDIFNPVQYWDVTLYSFCCLISFFIDSFAFTIRCSLFQRGAILILNCVQVFRSRTPHHLYESINIIQQTPPTLSQYKSEGPITIINIAGQMEPKFSKQTQQQRARQLLWAKTSHKKNSNLLADCQDLKGQCHNILYWFFSSSNNFLSRQTCLERIQNLFDFSRSYSYS